ncbi:MAG TPA: nuclear transport factor 2 family protein [Rhodospirillales bacterium]|nr:nuclear transport factor 2 family protein [Rhodospirillales bacterium]
MTFPDELAAYAAFFETLTPASLQQLDRLVTDDVIFRDPFNEVRGRDGMRRVFLRMFDDVVDPRFVVTATAREGNIAFVRWRFTGQMRASRAAPLRLEGVSEILLSADGKVSAHIDHWDAASQLYERLPLVGWLLRRLRRKLSVQNG